MLPILDAGVDRSVPGVVSRRLVLAGAGLAFASLATVRAQDPVAKVAKDAGPAGVLLAEFVAAMLPQAQAVAFGDEMQEDSYLFAAASLARRLRDLPAADYKPFPLLPDTETARLHRELPLIIELVRVSKNAKIPLHNHGGTLGLIVGLQGEMQVRNYQLADPAQGFLGDTVRLRQTNDGWVAPGRVSTLGSTRDNFHEVDAGPEGVVVFDVFTVLQRGLPSRFWDLAANPEAEDRRFWQARARPR